MAASDSETLVDDPTEGCRSCGAEPSEGRTFCSPGCASRYRARQRMLDKLAGGGE